MANHAESTFEYLAWNVKWFAQCWLLAKIVWVGFYLHVKNGTLSFSCKTRHVMKCLFVCLLLLVLMATAPNCPINIDLIWTAHFCWQGQGHLILYIKNHSSHQARIKNKSGDSSQQSVSEFHCNRCTGTIATDKSSYINWICRALDISMVSVFQSTPFTYIPVHK